jgi:hypothetical protein
MTLPERALGENYWQLQLQTDGTLALAIKQLSCAAPSPTTAAAMVCRALLHSSHRGSVCRWKPHKAKLLAAHERLQVCCCGIVKGEVSDTGSPIAAAAKLLAAHEWLQVCCCIRCCQLVSTGHAQLLRSGGGVQVEPACRPQTGCGSGHAPVTAGTFVRTTFGAACTRAKTGTAWVHVCMQQKSLCTHAETSRRSYKQARGRQVESPQPVDNKQQGGHAD